MKASSIDPGSDKTERLLVPSCDVATRYLVNSPTEIWSVGKEQADRICERIAIVKPFRETPGYGYSLLVGQVK